jgi:hypothetical protein
VRGNLTETCNDPARPRRTGAPHSARAVTWLNICSSSRRGSYAWHCARTESRRRSTPRTPWKGCATSRARILRSVMPQSGASAVRIACPRRAAGKGEGVRIP